MKYTALNQSLAIFLGIVFVFMVQITEISNYISYLLAILIVFTAIYISMKKRSKSASELFTGSPLELFTITSIILFIIVLTNGLSSPLFFLLYFILFLLAFMASNITIWVFMMTVLLFFVPEASANINTDTLLKLGSLVLLAPIAYFVGHELERRQVLNKKIEAKTDEIIQEAEAIKENGNPSYSEENEAIDEIIEEAESLKKDAES